MLVLNRWGVPIGLADDGDAELVESRAWRLHAGSKGKWAYIVDDRLQALHRLLVDAPPGFLVDHVNGDRTDNRRANLRLATHEQNLANSGPRGGSSRFKGVCWDSSKKRWVATHCRRRLGQFKSETDAALAFDEAAFAAHGEYAYLNFPRA